jgi:prephenate dehydratase
MARSNAASRRVATLGPNGTSSYTAAVHFAKTYPSSILLFPTYEDAADAVRSAPRDSALVVANAYASINRFYISHALSPIGAFFKDTPAYVVAAFDDDALDDADVTIASHPAPQHLIAHLAARPNVTILDADSTHQAAALVAEGKARACLTTRIAADLVGLKTLDVVIQTIPMLWTVFASKEH